MVEYVGSLSGAISRVVSGEPSEHGHLFLEMIVVIIVELGSGLQKL